MHAETLTFLELTSARKLVPGRPPPAPLHLQKVERAAASVARPTCARIGAPHGWTGRSSWSETQWEQELTRPGVRAWSACAKQEVIGFVELEADEQGDVGIVVFGLVPEFVGRGFGGAFLASATRLARGIRSPEGRSARRVWVQTSSRDHPHARPNAESRGSRAFPTEQGLATP